MPAEYPQGPGPPPQPRRLTGADSFWLRMDTPENLMMINGVMLFDDRLDLERLRAVIRERVLPVPRFCERVVISPSGTPRWEPYPKFDLNEHVIGVRLPGAADDTALRELVSARMSEPLDPARPRWRYDLVENYRQGSALIGRLHHCMGDGMGLMMVLLAMTDLEPDASPSLDGTTGRNPFLDLFRSSGIDFDTVRERCEEIMPEGLKLLLNPAEALRSLDGVRRSAASALALARLTFRGADSPTLLNGQPGLPKRAAWSDAVSIEDIKRIRNALGGTVNDILLNAMAGAIRRYLIEREGEAGCKDFRATVPVNLRPLDRIRTLGNEFGLVYLTVPVEIDDPVARLAELRRRSDRLKRSAEPLVSHRVMRLIGRMPASAQRLLVRMFASKATAVITNVPGPNRTLYLAGQAIQDMFFWVPRSARLSMGISIMSYRGSVRMGVATDAGLVPDPEKIAAGFKAEFEAMRQLARSAPGSRPGRRHR